MKLKFIEQADEKDCGPACLAMISHFYGKKSSIARIREYAETDLYGTNILGMSKAAEALGFDLEAFEIEEEEELYTLKCPFIAHIINDNGFNHFIIIKKITNKYIYITDPAKGHYKLTKDEYKKIFTNIILIIKMNENFNKVPESPSIFNFFADIFKKNQTFIWIILATSIVINIIGFIGAFYFKYLVDQIIPSTFVDNLHNVSIAILILYLIYLFTTFLRYQLVLNMGIKVNEYLMLKYYHHTLHLRMNFFETRKEGEILSRFRDTDKIREAFSSVTITLFVDIIMIILGSIILFIQSQILFYVVLCLIPVYILLAILFKKPFEKYNRQEMEENASLSSSFIEGIKGIDTIKSYNIEEKFFEKTNKIFNGLINRIYKLGIYTNIQISFKDFMTLTSTLIILWVGSIQVISGNITLGELLTFNALVVYYIGPIERLIESQSIIQSAVVSTRRVLEIIDLEGEETTYKEKSSMNFNSIIEFQDVDFRYGQREYALKNLKFNIHKGEKVALVGESGSGKSTIAKMMLKYYTPQKGNIYIDGNKLTDINPGTWRDKVSYVSQNNFVFFGTVLENLLINGTNNYSMEDVIKVCKAVGAHKFIKELPLGYYSVLESNGENLSGGEIQRICLARAFLKKADILILDEPTSALDFTTENKIKKYLENLDTTVIVISHRLNLVSNFDKIITFGEGEMLETGNHEHLLSQKKFYYNLWNHQLN
ncbi:peptidase domain-containing ABC transporter [Staphylococcus equorum]|nr:peptidase domain-containing ABC transporter [Staphylococcus equorum]MDG0838924.1 peptidase domain-containing ABC transporter [Staphylococcus equorum]